MIFVTRAAQRGSTRLSGSLMSQLPLHTTGHLISQMMKFLLRWEPFIGRGKAPP